MAYKNKLANEKSPYLLRNADSPVEWYPWGKEAFERAREEDKPVFLSVGHSACSWCRLMERECFSDEELGSLLNDACVSVKVDRDERPDLGALFMEVCRMQNGSGDWPLNLFLTPRGEPFFASGYLPKRTAGRMPGLADMTPRVKWLWLMQKEDVLRGAKNLVEAFAARMTFSSGGPIGSFHVKTAMKSLQSSFDKEWGGFGFTPKFPCAPRLLFLLALARGAGPEAAEALSMTDLTLRKMWAGGVHDHLGGGYARCATDRRWVMPRFEKTLYDQAMLLWVVTELHEAMQDSFYLKFAEDIAACVMRDFTSPESCFWTSIGAEGEGDGGDQYYCWTEEEIRELLPQGDAGIFCAAYAILPGGNFTHEMTSRQTGHNVLYEAIPYVEVARRYGLRAPDLIKRLENDRRVLLEARGRRPSPQSDDKVLMDWNGLMIGALARAGRVFEKKEWVLSAERAALFLQKTLVDPKGAWRRRYRLKDAAIPALPGDYAALMWGVTELREAAPSEKQKRDWLRYAENLAAKLEAGFWDESEGGFFLSPGNDPLVFLRPKTAIDDDVPSANAMAMMAYAALGKAAPDGEKYLEKAAAISSCFVRAVGARPLDHISLVTASLRLREAKDAPKDKDAKDETSADG